MCTLTVTPGHVKRINSVQPSYLALLVIVARARKQRAQTCTHAGNSAAATYPFKDWLDF